MKPRELARRLIAVALGLASCQGVFATHGTVSLSPSPSTLDRTLPPSLSDSHSIVPPRSAARVAGEFVVATNTYSSSTPGQAMMAVLRFGTPRLVRAYEAASPVFDRSGRDLTLQVSTSIDRISNLASTPGRWRYRVMDTMVETTSGTSATLNFVETVTVVLASYGVKIDQASL